jgi:hypothetical protein
VSDFYEEKYMDGDFWYRTDDKDIWHRFTYDMLLEKIRLLEGLPKSTWIDPTPPPLKSCGGNCNCIKG